MKMRLPGTPILRLLTLFAVILALAALPGFGVDASPGRAEMQASDDDDDDEERDDDEKEKKKEKDEEEQDKDDDDGEESEDDGDGDGERVDPAATYLVAVSCAYVPAVDQSTCGFVGITERGIEDIGAIVVSEATICAPVTGGVYANAVDPATGGNGYGSPAEAGGIVTLILDGEVTTSGTATFWVTTGEQLLPATGPGLDCAVRDATATLDATMTDLSDTTGAVRIQAYTCGDILDPDAIEWFEACDPISPGVGLTVTGEDKQVAGEEPRTGTTDDAGQLDIGELPPGTYALEKSDGGWCHAESDSVDEAGDVIVQAGQRSTVWIFICT